MKNNELRIDLSGNPQLAEFFEGKKVGHTCELTVRGKVKEIDQNEVVLAIDKVSYEHQGEDTEVEPEAEKPMAMAMMPTTYGTTEKG